MASDELFRDCWRRAIYAYGTAAIFLRRSRRYQHLIRALAFIGIVVPVLVGGFVMGFGINSPRLPDVVAGAAVLGLFQLAFSAAAIVYGWAESLQYAQESAAENLDLAAQFEDIGRRANDPPADVDLRHAALRARDESRRNADAKRAIASAELRYGHRAALRQFSRACEACRQVPTAMEPTNCDVCGRF
jgi:mobilome CxxCx(11)CxxC protein